MPAPHPLEFRRRAVELGRLGAKPISAIAKELSISVSARADPGSRPPVRSPRRRIPTDDSEEDGLQAPGVSMRVARDNVGRLRQRIFKAAQAGDHKKVRSLQKLMLRSHSNTLLDVERVTELNAGRATAGVDGEVALTDEPRAELVQRVTHEARTWRPCRSSGCTSPKPVQATNSGRSAFP